MAPPGGGAPAATVALNATGGSASVASPAAGQWTVAMEAIAQALAVAFPTGTKDAVTG